MSNNHLNYIKKSYNNSFDNNIGEINIMGVLICVKDPLPNNVDMRGSLEYVLKRMPRCVLDGIERIMIGQFEFLKSRHVDAIYDDGIIYVSNDNHSNLDFYTDIVHEVGHAFEEKNNTFLYGDGEIEREFLGKRRRLFELLYANNLTNNNITREMFEETLYNKKFDNYLYKEIGYNLLRNFTNGLFISPYASTCLREYFGNGFEIFFVNDVVLVKKNSTSIYNKLVKFLEINDV